MTQNISSNSDLSNQPQAALSGPRWPEGAVVYHIYPRSLQDSDGDGVGDLPGITSRLDYLKELGVTAIWLSPFYPSPMADFGYDVADYCDVAEEFGTIDDFKELLKQADALDMKVMIDLVPNHTSDEHPWFRDSRQSRSNTYSDWYIWRDGSIAEDGNRRPPNNWLDALSGRSAWRWDDARQQYYLHSFHVKQPDLNWSNPNVREAIKQAMRFWLDLGVDGFRVDAVYWMSKDPLMRDDAPNGDYVPGEDPPYESLAHDNSRGWPAVYSHLNELAGVLKEDSYKDKERFMVTEAYPERHNPVASYMAFYEGVDPLVAAPFNFEGVSLPWSSQAWHRFLKTFHTTLLSESPLCVPSYAFGNHDQSRLASRVGSEAARSAAVMLLTLPGTAFIYYGEELGMVDVAIPPERVQDPAALGDPAKGQGRDPARTPMQWSAEVNGGFSEAAETWLPLAPDYKQRNVESQAADPGSMLSLYRHLGELRQRSDVLRHGTLEVLDLKQPNALAYIRRHSGQSMLTIINFSHELVDVELDGAVSESLGACVVTSLHAKTPPVHEGVVQLEANQAVVFELARRVEVVGK